MDFVYENEFRLQRVGICVGPYVCIFFSSYLLYIPVLLCRTNNQPLLDLIFCSSFKRSFYITHPKTDMEPSTLQVLCQFCGNHQHRVRFFLDLHSLIIGKTTNNHKQSSPHAVKISKKAATNKKNTLMQIHHRYDDRCSDLPSLPCNFFVAWVHCLAAHVCICLQIYNHLQSINLKKIFRGLVWVICTRCTE